MNTILRMKHNVALCAAIMLGVSALLYNPLLGATRIANVSGAWSNSSTWSGGIVPSSTDTVIVDGGVSVTIDISAECASIRLGRSIPLPGNGLLLFPDSLSVLFVAGDITLGQDSAVGTITMIGGFLRIGGSLTINNGTIDPSGGTVEYNNPVSQTIASATYHNLYLNGGQKTGAGPLTVNGDIVIYQTATFTAGAYVHSVRGDWWNIGNFIAGTSTIVFNGSSPQSIIGQTTFNKVVIENTSGVSLSGTQPHTINGLLTFNGGTLSLGDANLILGPVATTTGGSTDRCIITNGTGGVIHRINGGVAAASFLFPVAATPVSYNPLTITLKPILGEQTETFTIRVSVFDSTSPGFATTDTSLCTWRLWTVTEASNGGNHANLTFQWNENEDGSNIGITRGSPVMATVYRYDPTSGQYQVVDAATGPPPVSELIVATTSAFQATLFQQTSYLVGNNSLTTSVEEIANPDAFELQQNYPNPFNPVTNIRFGLPASGFVSLKVYDLLGREVATLVNETRAPGSYTERFDARSLASGTYLYRLTTPSQSATRKLILVR